MIMNLSLSHFFESLNLILWLKRLMWLYRIISNLLVLNLCLAISLSLFKGLNSCWYRRCRLCFRFFIIMVWYLFNGLLRLEEVIVMALLNYFSSSRGYLFLIVCVYVKNFFQLDVRTFLMGISLMNFLLLWLVNLFRVNLTEWLVFCLILLDLNNFLLCVFFAIFF